MWTTCRCVLSNGSPSVSDRILVTGAGGYLGRQVVERLRNSGVETIGVVRRASDASLGRVAMCDLADASAVERLVSQVSPSAVVHAAAWIGSGPATAAAIDSAFSSNVRATANLVAAVAKAGVSRLVFCSTVEVYGSQPQNGMAHREDDTLDPQGLYGHTKAAGEFIVRSLEGTATHPTIFRMPGLHGAPRLNGIVHRLLVAAATSEPIELPEPETRLSFLWVADAARVFAAAALGELRGSHAVLNIANGDTTLVELAARVGRVPGKSLELCIGSAAPRNRALDLARMQGTLPFELLPFEDGLRLTCVAAPAD